LYDRDIDGFLISGLSNVKYFSGFDGFHGAILITQHHKILFTDFTHYTQACENITDFSVRCLTAPLMTEIGHLTMRMGLSRVAFDPLNISYSDFHQLSKGHSKLELIPLQNTISRMRELKSREEIQTIKRSATICDKAVENILKNIKVGNRENLIASQLDSEIRHLNADYPAFETQVLSGLRTCLPHGRTSDKKIDIGELVIIDFGARCRGYHSDCTRTIVIGKVSTRQTRIYKVVLDSLKMALSKVKPGVRCKVIDKIGREVINSAGYEPFFQHSFGHGVGLDVHEAPVIDQSNDRILESGMVFTLEPGIYIPGWGGIRIEELVQVTKNGYQILTKFNRESLMVIE